MSINIFTRLRTLIVIFTILVILTPALNVSAYSATAGVTVTRIINGSDSDVPGYEPGDNFTVTLNYQVTGTQYVVNLRETLPAGWEILDSTEPYTFYSGPNKASWNITSPLNGVRSGIISYLVHIPDSATPGTTESIDGITYWFSSYSAVKSGTPTGDTGHYASAVDIVAEEHNGPAIWIYKPIELIGNGNGHIENGERAGFIFFVNDKDGVSEEDISSFINGIAHNGQVVYDDGQYIEIQADATVTWQDNQANIFAVSACDGVDDWSIFSYRLYVPLYSMEEWLTVEWNGMEADFARSGFTSDPDNGNWVWLSGGEYVDMPQLETNYDGPGAINKNFIFNGLPLFPFFDMFAGAVVSANVTVPPQIEGPFIEYPIYVENNNSANDVSMRFAGKTELKDQCFNVYLLNLTKISDKIDFTSLSTINQSIRKLTLSDITAAKVNSVEVRTDQNGDLTVDGVSPSGNHHGNIPELNDMRQGYYALIVMDLNLPNTPVVVGTAPFVVTKCEVEVVQLETAPLPGDSITFYETLHGVTPGKDYVYLTMLVPEQDYKGIVDIDSNGTLNGTITDFTGFGMNMTVTAKSDGTRQGSFMYIVGQNGTYVMDSNTNMQQVKNMMMSEFNTSTMAFAFKNTTEIEDVELVVQTRNTMPEGKYMVLTAVMERDTARVAAIDVSTTDIGKISYTFNLKSGWNLISVPLDVEDNSINGIFPQSARNNIVVIRQYDPNSNDPWAYYTPRTDIYDQGTLTAINEKAGYWVLCDCNVTFNINGVPHADSTVTLNNGWTLAGNPTMETRNVQNVYGSNDIVVVWQYDSTGEDAWTYYTPRIAEYDQGTLTTLKPGFGYWILRSV